MENHASSETSVCDEASDSFVFLAGSNNFDHEILRDCSRDLCKGLDKKIHALSGLRPPNK